MTAYRGAVLIIGSLWWDPSPIRKNWRNTRLKQEEKQLVYVPIRYGRESSSRGNTYTMIFSQLCYRKNYGLGTALLLPFQQLVERPDDLIKEASELWKAEAEIKENNSSVVSASWGAIGLLIRPNLKFPKEMVQRWANHYQAQRRLPSFVHLKTEKPAIEKGFLNFRWLNQAHKNAPVDFDFILATATEPTIENGRYPSAKTIANAWQKDADNNIRYFRNNLTSDITTFQDQQILKFLEQRE